MINRVQALSGIPIMTGAVLWRWARPSAAPPQPPQLWAPVDMRGKLKTRPPSQWQQPFEYPYYYRDTLGITGSTIHYTAGPASSTVQDVAAFQTGPDAQEAFPAIAYHVLVDGEGIAYLCHDLNVRVWGSGQPGANESQVHICYTGLIEPNAKQIPTIRNAVKWADDQFAWSLALKGHKDGYATQCPGPKWPDWKPAITP